MTTGAEYLAAARKYEGAKYSQDYKLRTGPTHFDCSGLVWRAADDLGITVPHGTVAQGLQLNDVPLVRALVTPGAILWREGHDGISYGDFLSIEARNYEHGVKSLDFRFGRFTKGLLIPGVVYTTPYPYTDLLVDGDRGMKTNLAWKWFMRLNDAVLDMNVDLGMQRWLRAHKAYKGLLDGDFGPMSVTALQSVLKTLGWYTGALDGDRGPMTVKAEQKFLNSKRKNLTS